MYLLPGRPGGSLSRLREWLHGPIVLPVELSLSISYKNKWILSIVSVLFIKFIQIAHSPAAGAFWEKEKGQSAQRAVLRLAFRENGYQIRGVMMPAKTTEAMDTVVKPPTSIFGSRMSEMAVFSSEETLRALTMSSVTIWVPG